MNSDVADVLRREFGHDGLRDHQQAAISAVLQGRAAMVVLPTGGGKSLCFQLPAVVLHRQGRGCAIVVSPLVALMQDQVDALTRQGIKASFINATVPRRERQRRLDAMERGELAMMYVVPERFRRPPFRAALERTDVSLVAIDEAHCISHWGHDFRPDYRLLGTFTKACTTVKGNPAPLIALTATATPGVESDIIDRLGMTDVVRIRAPVYRANLRLAVVGCHGITDKAEHIAELLKRIGGAAIIYTGLIARGEKLRAELEERGVHLRFYNGDLPAGPRKRLSRAFIAEDEPALLATNAFGMGIDRPDVRLIVHCEIPGAVESWAQEIGRAGRDNGPSLCLALLDDDDLAIHQQHVRNAHPDAATIVSVWEAIAEMNGVSAGWTEARFRQRFAGRDRRDHRAITAMRLLASAGCIGGSFEGGDLHVLDEPSGELVDQSLIDARRLRGHERLLTMLALWRRRSCLWQGIAAHFGESLQGDEACRACSADVGLERLLEGLPHRHEPLAEREPPRRVDDLPYQVGDWIQVGKRMGQVARIGGRPQRRQLRVLMADSMREERVIVHADGPSIRKL